MTCMSGTEQTVCSSEPNISGRNVSTIKVALDLKYHDVLNILLFFSLFTCFTENFTCLGFKRRWQQSATHMYLLVRK